MTTNPLKDYVLRAIGDDYEDFAMILNEVRQWATRHEISVTEEEVLKALEQTISDGYAAAYVLSSSQPYVKPTLFSRENLSALSFYATPEGKDALSRMEFDQ